jgi:uncharacterized membrane protein
MADLESLLNRWLAAGVVDQATADRIRTHEQGDAQRSGLRWQGLVALTLGAILLACGVVLFVSAHWDQLGPLARFVLVMAMVAVFHLAGAWARAENQHLSTALHAVGTAAAGAAIALVGQIFNLQEHWPAAVLLWAICALAGWALLRDQAQQTMALLLVPAWIFCELEYATEAHIGQEVYLGRFLVLWSAFYFVMLLGSRRKAVQGILFAVDALAIIVGTVLMLLGWRSWSGEQSFFGYGTMITAWVVMGAVPFCVSALRGHKGLVPITAAIAYAVGLPWCQRIWTETYHVWDGSTYNYTRTSPNLLAHLVVAAFAVYLCLWGIQQASRWLVNFGMVGFALAVGWFYYSNLFDALGRSLGLIGLGVLFLAGGWALEKLRRRIMTRMDAAQTKEAQ